MLVASAVILPDTVEQPPSPSLSKRRQSSVSEVDSKRPRLSEYGSRERVNGSSPPAAETKTTPKSEESVKLEERKRGKRLFGALLGTLAQSSSSTAQNRRVDIERKQQAKLKLQDEEHDEKKKQKLSALMEVRRQEQKKYDKQSMQIRHSNLLATAHFLRTKAEPKLYYMPWNRLPEEEDEIKRQIEEAEATVEKETAAYKAKESETAGNVSVQESETTSKASGATRSLETVGPITNAGPSNSAEEPNTNQTSSITHNNSVGTSKMIEVPEEVHKDHVDDGGEVVVEGDEDTVIY